MSSGAFILSLSDLNVVLAAAQQVVAADKRKSRDVGFYPSRLLDPGLDVPARREMS
jgi:hypothetical protein